MSFAHLFRKFWCSIHKPLPTRNFEVPQLGGGQFYGCITSGTDVVPILYILDETHYPRRARQI